jgi:hypothetical protein
MIEAQMACFPKIGLSRKLGSAALGKIQTSYAQDKEVKKANVVVSGWVMVVGDGK